METDELRTQPSVSNKLPPSTVTKTTVIIPCYGEINESLLPLTGKLSPAMIPLNGKPVIFHTIDYLIGQGLDTFVIPVRKEDSFLCSFLRDVFGDRATINFVVPDRDGDIGYTLLCAAKYVKTDHALVVFGDTYFTFSSEELLSFDNSFVLVHPVKEVSRWCLAELDLGGNVSKLVDKPKSYDGDPLALIGVYGIAKWASFVESLTEELEKSIIQGKSNISLTKTLESYGSTEQINGVTPGSWFDCGHSDTLLNSQRRLLKGRSFNSLEFDELRGVLTKRSANKAKFLDEIDYYVLLPKDLQIYFPRVISSDTKWDNLNISLEYYGYPTLSESLLFEKLESRVWHSIFSHLFSIHQDFRKHSAKFGTAPVEEMYISRVESRLEELRRDNVLRSLIDSDGLSINGEKFPKFSTLWSDIKSELLKLVHNSEWSIIHGDLCFSNILYDLNGRLCKFIDPRGSFGVRGTYGDPRYDIAKLYHSIDGLYDFIVNDLFTVKLHGEEIELKIAAPEHISLVQKEFAEIFFSTYSRHEISLIEGILFISMGVFHSDSKSRQIAFFAKGLSILRDVIEGKRQ